MVYVVVSMVVILLVAAGVVVYAAYPHRGEKVPAAPWLGDAMVRAADAVPVLHEHHPHDGAGDYSLAESLRRDTGPDTGR